MRTKTVACLRSVDIEIVFICSLWVFCSRSISYTSNVFLKVLADRTQQKRKKKELSMCFMIGKLRRKSPRCYGYLSRITGVISEGKHDGPTTYSSSILPSRMEASCLMLPFKSLSSLSLHHWIWSGSIRPPLASSGCQHLSDGPEKDIPLIAVLMLLSLVSPVV